MDGIRERLGRAAAHPFAWALALGIAYLVLARLTLVFVGGETGVATRWPASGVALAAFAIAPRRWWPALAASVFAADLIAQSLVGDALATSLALAAVNAAEPVLAAVVLACVCGRGRDHVDITSVRVIGGIAAAAFGANAVTAALGAGVLLLEVGGPPVLTWESWWLAHGVGMLIVAPVLLTLARSAPGRASRLEAVALVWLTAAVAVLFFGRHAADGPMLLRFAFPLVPMLLWCALRLGTRGTTIAILAVATIASVTTTHDLGPFAIPTLTAVERIQALQAFLALAVLSTLLVAAVVASQRRTEARASAEAERLNSLLRASEAAIIAVDLSGAITHFNAGAERMLGYAARDIVGRPASELHDTQEVATRAAQAGLDVDTKLFVRTALRGETRDWTWIHADGQRLTVALTMSTQRDRDGRVTGFLGMATDVTERREAQRLLAASEERHRLVLSNLPDAQVYLYDRDLVCVLAEGQAMPPDTDESHYLGRHVGDLLDPGDLAYGLPLFEAALRGTPTHTNYVSPRTGRHHELHLVPQRGATGGPEGVLVVMRDITERRQQEQAVQRAEADLRTIFDEAQIGNAVFDARLRLVEANAALQAMTGYEAHELADAPVDGILRPEQAARMADLMARVSRGQQRDAEIEIAFRHADGHEVDLSLHIVGLGVDGDGSRRRTLVQVVDVSERKRFEERLRHLADHDSLTGVRNRRRFEAELSTHVGRGRRYGPQGAVILVDADGFKQVNDTRGHAAGDEVIVTIARTLGARLRSSDVLARLGGDEFAILLPHGSLAEACAVAQGLVEAVRTETEVTISVGVALAERCAVLTAEQLLRDADRAMYAAKAAGRDGYAVFGEPALTAPRAASAAPPSPPTS